MASEGKRQPEISDVVLLQAVAADDANSLGILYDRHARAIYGFLNAVTAVGGEDLDDLVHDTFLAVFKAARTYSKRSTVRTWLFGIAINISRNHLRRQARRQKALSRFQVDSQQPPRPDEKFQSTQELSRLATAIAQLPVKLRLAYVTSVLEEFSGNEAAHILGVRKGTLWRRVHEARERLRVEIGRGENA